MSETQLRPERACPPSGGERTVNKQSQRPCVRSNRSLSQVPRKSTSSSRLYLGQREKASEKTCPASRTVKGPRECRKRCKWHWPSEDAEA